MSAGPLVSIVVPVYNVERYLDECLKSLVRQTYTNIEIILVDDGSTDASGKKCDVWTKQDARIKVIHKDNEGLNYARRDGYRKSSGAYITFLDSDDLFHEENIRLSLQEAISSHADIVSYAFTKFSDDSDHEKLVNTPVLPYETRTLSSKRAILEYIFLENGIFPGTHAVTAWGKLYKRAVVEPTDWTVSNYRSYEDNLWTPQLFATAKRVVLLSCALSFYRRNDEYGVQGETLGNRLVGNTYEGKPVGYVELIDISFNYYRKLAKAHKIGIEKELFDKRFLYMRGRFGNLITAGLVGRENNLQYLNEVWQELNRRYIGLEHQNEDLRDSIIELRRQNAEISMENNELRGSLSWRITQPLRFAKKIIKSVIQ